MNKITNTCKYLAIAPIAITSLYSCKSNNKKEVNENKKMNVVFILADDIGYSQIGCNGSDYYETPNIDSLSEEGLNFTNAYAAAAVSSPTRASIMTGKYPARLHLTDFIKGDTFPNSSLITPNWQKYLKLEETTLGELFKSSGYTTAMFGKWHLSIDKYEPESLPFNPNKQGFDEHIVTHKPKSDEDPFNDPHNVEQITKRSIDFIERKKDTNFFLFVSHNSIHDPLIEKPGLVKKYSNKEGVEKDQNHPVIGAMIESLDNSVGKILTKINSLGLSENTIVIFYGDNGGKASYAAQTPFRAGKGWLYEGGIREPLIIKWPGVTKENSTTNQVVSSIDFFPTFSSYLGKESTGVDGMDIKKFLKPDATSKERTLFWNYPHYHRGSGMMPAAAIRKGNYKMIIWYEDFLKDSTKGIELYNLAKDKSEAKDISSDNTEILNELLEDFRVWEKEAKIQVPQLKN